MFPEVERMRKMELSPEERDALITTLKERFEKHRKRHAGIEWAAVEERLEKHPDKLWSLHEMERTGGEPDVIGQDKKSGEITFVDCSKQSPSERRSLCYDREALDKRKEAKPRNSAVDMANEMGIAMLTAEEYQALQKLDEFDTTTSSWVVAPEEIRKRGGAIFGDRRYNTVFIYHNGADSYYGSRGFRGKVVV